MEGATPDPAGANENATLEDVFSRAASDTRFAMVLRRFRSLRLPFMRPVQDSFLATPWSRRRPR